MCDVLQILVTLNKGQINTNCLEISVEIHWVSIIKKIKQRYQIIKYKVWYISYLHINICFNIRNLKIILSLATLYTQSQIYSHLPASFRAIILKSWHYSLSPLCISFPNQPSLIMSSSLQVHWNCSYQVHYHLPNPMSIIWFILPHLSRRHPTLLLTAKMKKSFNTFPLGFQTTTPLYSSFLSCHPLVFLSLNFKWVVCTIPWTSIG